MTGNDELKARFRICEQCGTCTAACHFSDSGRLNVRKVIRRVNLGMCGDGFLSSDPWKCSLCGRCAKLCVEGLDVPALMSALRDDARARGLEPAAAAQIAAAIAGCGTPFRAPGRTKASWIERECPPSAGAEVLYWAGCGSALMLPNIAASSARLIRAFAGEFSILPDEPCCGEPLVAVGRLDEARAAAEKAVHAVRASGAKTMVVSCSGCFATFTRHYPALFGIDPGVRVLHVSQFLAERGLRLEARTKTRIAYHDPCSLGRGCGVYDEPRAVLKSIGGIELVEIPPSRDLSLCCGGGGGVWSVDNAAAQSAASAKFARAVLPLGADMLVTCCPVCHLNFRAAARKAKSKIRVLDLAEAAAAAI